MPSPFPGMDPYLERAGIWQQVHADLIVDIRRYLAPLLRPKYHIAIEQTTYLTLLPPHEQRIGVPDVLVTTPAQQGGDRQAATAATPIITGEPLVAEIPQPEEITQRYLEIRDMETKSVITIIEILSPANKLGREGREQYEQKRLKLLGTLTHLVEIDLLRAGQPLPINVEYQSDYRIIISRSHRRPQADAYIFSVRDAIPNFPIPLRPDEEEPVLTLNDLLHDLYDKGGYDLVLDYQSPPVPPLANEAAVWAQKIIASKGNLSS